MKLTQPKRNTGWTAVDGQGGLFGVTVDTSRKTGPKPRVVRHAHIVSNPVPEPAEFQLLARQLSESKFPVIGLLNRSEYQIFLVDKAMVRPEEMLQSLRLTLSTLLDYPPEQANLAWMDVPVKNSATPNPTKLYVVAAKTLLVDQRMRDFEQARMRLSVMDIRETAQANLAQCVESPSSGVCLIYADPMGLQITISHQGDLYLERFIRESLFEAVEAVSADTQREKFDRIALEIQRSLDFVRRNFLELDVSLLFIAPTATDIGLHRELSSRLLQPFNALDLSNVFDWPEDSELVKPEVQALYFNALGASLRTHG